MEKLSRNNNYNYVYNYMMFRQESLPFLFCSHLNKIATQPSMDNLKHTRETIGRKPTAAFPHPERSAVNSAGS